MAIKPFSQLFHYSCFIYSSSDPFQACRTSKEWWLP